MKRLATWMLGVTLAQSTAGCAALVELNAQAIAEVADPDASDRDRETAAAVILASLGLVAALGAGAAIDAAVSSPPPEAAPAGSEVVDELGWGVTRNGREASWFRCRSVHVCTEEPVTAGVDDLLDVSPAGSAELVGSHGPRFQRVDVVALRVRRAR